mmetsp:Transcript_4841/g.11676  ORF Transcript_4841/g.11676 Transcript_4841/m.11676 type:complete len:221 (+) Transcript_4841:776-1438(+)
MEAWVMPTGYELRDGLHITSFVTFPFPLPLYRRACCLIKPARSRSDGKIVGGVAGVVVCGFCRGSSSSAMLTACTGEMRERSDITVTSTGSFRRDFFTADERVELISERTGDIPCVFKSSVSPTIKNAFKTAGWLERLSTETSSPADGFSEGLAPTDLDILWEHIRLLRCPYTNSPLLRAKPRLTGGSTSGGSVSAKSACLKIPLMKPILCCLRFSTVLF